MAKKILLIDDDALVLKSVKRLLENQGYEVISVKNSEEALKVSESASFNLIISDIRMPGENGIATVRKIQEMLKRSTRADIPSIFITGYASEEAPIDALKLGAKDYLLKPFDFNELISSVKRNIG
ncbi:MAG: response regulator [Candidatus Omnitrophica bacterium]|nr:response regulator [Candidatus Omnitrophota bacterium]